MTNEEIRHTLNNCFHAFNDIRFTGADAEKVIGIKQAIGTLHEEMNKRIQNEKVVSNGHLPPSSSSSEVVVDG